MYNSLTLEATCKCGFSWRSRSGKQPRKCPKCGSVAWNCDTKKYTSIIARIGQSNETTGYREACFIEYVDSPSVVTDSLFYISKKDQETYFNGRSPPGSALILLGNYEIGEDKLLKINEMKLVFCFEATFRSYVSTVSCLYNIKSFYQKQAALKQYNEDQLLKEQMEDAKKETAIKAARARLDAARAKDLKVAEAERMLEDANVSTDAKMEAIKLLRN